MLGKNNSPEKKIITFIVSAIFMYAAVEGLKNMIKKRAEQNRTSAMLDKKFEEMNRGFPKEIAPNVTIDRIYRENKKIYLVYTSAAMTSKSIDFNEHAKDSKNM